MPGIETLMAPGVRNHANHANYEINRPASEASISGIAPLTAMGLDRPRQDYMIFDRARCVIHTTTNPWAVLRLRDDLHCRAPMQ